MSGSLIDYSLLFGRPSRWVDDPSPVLLMNTGISSIADIRQLIAGRQPHLLAAETGRHAAVALILRETEYGPEVLFIERARHDTDPWSGDIGFPGGKIEAGEAEARLEVCFLDREDVSRSAAATGSGLDNGQTVARRREG